jgi:hypothetical protein
MNLYIERGLQIRLLNLHNQATSALDDLGLCDVLKTPKHRPKRRFANVIGQIMGKNVSGCSFFSPEGLLLVPKKDTLKVATP